MIISDVPSFDVTHDHHSDNTRGVIYALREPLQYWQLASLIKIIIYDCPIFIVRATDQ
jgi:hypothetical protein